MREHGPETPQRGGADGNAQLGDILLQKGKDELAAPGVALAIGAGQEGTRKAAAQPQGSQAAYADFFQGKPAQLMIGDASGQRFRALSQEFRGGAAQDQETRR